jgi:hypothetical protein
MVLMLIAGSCSDPPRSGTGSTKGNGVSTTSKFAKSLDTFRAAIAADHGVSGALLQVSPCSDKVIALTEAAPLGCIAFLGTVEMARRLAWVHPGYRFVATPSDCREVATPPGGGPSALSRAAGGAVTLTSFMVASRAIGFQAAVKCVVQRDLQDSYAYSSERA